MEYIIAMLIFYIVFNIVVNQIAKFFMLNPSIRKALILDVDALIDSFNKEREKLRECNIFARFSMLYLYYVSIFKMLRIIIRSIHKTNIPTIVFWYIAFVLSLPFAIIGSIVVAITLLIYTLCGK